MKKNFIVKSMLMIALICMPLLFASCSEDEEVTTIVYNMGFESLNTSDLTEMVIIETTYQQALGVSANTFTLSGSVSECDSKVISACMDAESALKSRAFKGSYLFVVKNYISGKKIYSCQFNY